LQKSPIKETMFLRDVRSGKIASLSDRTTFGHRFYV